MTHPERAVIVGASIGGLTVAETLRQEGFEGEITLLGDEPYAPYNRPPLSKQVLLGEWEAEQASVRTDAELDALGIDFRPSCAAVALDTTARVVHTARGPVSYDELIIATGSAPRRHQLLPTALVLRTMDDALALRDGLRRGRRIAVVGAGVLGAEVASAARKYDADVLLIGRSDKLAFGAVGTLLSDRLIALHQDNGVDLALRTEVVTAEPAGDTTRLGLRDGRIEPVDLVVVMIGGTPRTDWLVGSTLTLDNGVVCDSAGHAAEGVSAVGDVAAWASPITGRPIRVEHQSNAIEQAIAVASRIGRGVRAAPPTPLFWSEVHRTRIQAYGWFDPTPPLESIDGGAPGDAAVLVARDAGGVVRGAVGWNASPRDFRGARASVTTTSISPAA